VLLFGWTVSGSLSAQGVPPFGQFACARLSTRINGANQSDDFGVLISIGGDPFYSPAPRFIENHFTIGGGQVSGSGRVQSQFRHDVQAGTPFTFEAALRSSVSPCCCGATMESSFPQSAHLSTTGCLGPPCAPPAGEPGEQPGAAGHQCPARWFGYWGQKHA
jgi:hypothetical protein